MSQPPAAHAAAAPALDTVLQTDALGALISRFAGGVGAVSKLACVSAQTLTILRDTNTKAAVERAQPADAFSHIVRKEKAMSLIFRYGGDSTLSKLACVSFELHSAGRLQAMRQGSIRYVFRDEELIKITDANTLLKEGRFHTRKQENTSHLFAYLCVVGITSSGTHYDAGTLNDTLIAAFNRELAVCFPKSEEAAVLACLARAASDPPTTTLAVTPDTAVDKIEQFVTNCGFRVKLVTLCHMAGTLTTTEWAGNWFYVADGESFSFCYDVVDDQNRDGVRTLLLRGTFDHLGGVAKDELEVQICGDIVSGTGSSPFAAYYMVEGTIRDGRMELRKGVQFTIEANGPPAEGWPHDQAGLVTLARAARVPNFTAYRYATPPWAPRTTARDWRLPDWRSKPWLYLAAMAAAHVLPEAIRRRDAWSDADRAADAAKTKRFAFYRYCDRAAEELIKHEVAVLKRLDDAKIRERVVPRIIARDAYIAAVRRQSREAGKKRTPPKKKKETRRSREGRNSYQPQVRRQGRGGVPHNAEEAFFLYRFDKFLFEPGDPVDYCC